MQKPVLALAFFLVILTGAHAQQEKIEVIGVEAKLEQENIAVEIIALNKGTVGGNIKITTSYFGQVDERNEEVPPDSTKKLTYIVHNVKPGNIKMSIENGVKKFVEITIPEKSTGTQDLFVREISAENYFAKEENNSQNIVEKIEINPYYAAVGIAVIFLIIVAAKIMLPKRGKKFEMEEIELEKNAELLKEADEARKTGKIKKIRV